MLKWWWSTILCDVEGDDSKFDHGLLQKYPQAATIMDSCFLASAVSWRQMQPLSLATSQKRHGSFFLTPRERPKAPWILRNLFCSFFTGRILFHQTSRLNSVERLMFGNSPPSFRKNIFPEPEKNEGFPPKKHFFFFFGTGLDQVALVTSNRRRSSRQRLGRCWTRETVHRLGVCAPKWWFRIRESPPKNAWTIQGTCGDWWESICELIWKNEFPHKLIVVVW